MLDRKKEEENKKFRQGRIDFDIDSWPLLFCNKSMQSPASSEYIGIPAATLPSFTKKPTRLSTNDRKAKETADRMVMKLNQIFGEDYSEYSEYYSQGYAFQRYTSKLKYVLITSSEDLKNIFYDDFRLLSEKEKSKIKGKLFSDLQEKRKQIIEMPEFMDFVRDSGENAISSIKSDLSNQSNNGKFKIYIENIIHGLDAAYASLKDEMLENRESHKIGKP